MKDPFQAVDSMGDTFLLNATTALEARAEDAQVIPIIAAYLDELQWPDDGLHVEVGSGTGAIAGMMASRAGSGRVIGIDPSIGLVRKAGELRSDIENLSFEVGDGSQLRFDADSVDNVVMHTVLSHVPRPEELLEEAHRVLRPGGRLAICDADFEKTTLGNFDGDPLDACAQYFIRNFVTHPYLISHIRRFATAAGFDIRTFRITARPITDTDGGLSWIRFTNSQMVSEGQIGESLARSLEEEYGRRKQAGTLYGFQPFGTLLAVKR